MVEGNFMPDKEVVHSHIGSLGNLALDRIKTKMEKANGLIHS